MPNDQVAIVAELYSRRATLDPEKAAVVDELAKRFNIPQQPAAVAAPKSFAGQVVDNITNSHKLLGTAAAGVVSQFNPVNILQPLAELTADPIGTSKAMLQSVANVGGKAYDSFQRGDYTEAVRHGINYLVPLGTQADELGDRAQTAQTPEEIARVAGESVGVGLVNALPDAPIVRTGLTKAKVTLVPQVTKANAKVQSAIDFARRRNIPVDAATATQNKFVQAIQHGADHSPGGSIIESNARHATEEAMTRTLRDLADEAHPTPVDPVQAGADTRGAIEEKIGTKHREASGEYTKLWERESDPANVERVQVGTKEVERNGKKMREPVYEDMGLPVDMREAKKRLRPTYDRIKRAMPIAQQRMSEGFKAIENVMSSRDFEPASIVDGDLSAIKAAARGADLPELATLSQGLAKHAVKHLDEQVRAAVQRAKVYDGPAPGAATAPAAAESPTAPKTARPVVEGKATPSAGTETEVSVPGQQQKYKARYEVRELEDVQPSHMGQTFEANPKYKLKNDRNYKQAENQRKVVDWSSEEQFDPSNLVNTNNTATAGPIIIDSTGDALGGNGRTMILQRVYGAGKEGAAKYRGLLESRAAHFGIDPESIKGMRQPVLVRVIDDAEFGKPNASKQRAITDFNVKETAELTPSERAIAGSRRVSPATLDDIGARMEAAGKDATLAQVLEGPAGVEVFQKLVNDGVISPQETAAFVSGEQLTKAGKERIHSLMLGRYFRDPAQLDTIAPSVRGKIERIAAPLATVEASEAWNLSPHVQDSIELSEKARIAGGTLDDYLKQGGLLIDQEYSPQSIALAKQLKDTNPNDLVNSVRKYADWMHYEGNYQGPGLFGDLPEPLTPAQAFKDAFGVELPAGATMEPTPRAAPKFASFSADEMPVKADPPKRPTKNVGADALGELERGRRATVQKYEAAEVLKKMRAEPGEAFKQFIYAEDASIEHVNRVAQQAPEEMPRIARAVLQDILEKATRDGGFDRAKTIAGQWERIGPKTKRVLFNNPKLISELDNFFLLAKKAAERANPSGSTTTALSFAHGAAIFAHPVSGVLMTLSTAALSKMMHSAKGVEALTHGLRVPAGKGAVSAMAANRILKAAGELARPLQAKPAARDTQPASDQRRTASGR